ncbi:MAG: cation-translocating P-type ATPase [Pseudomonadota bacterium]
MSTTIESKLQSVTPFRSNGASGQIEDISLTNEERNSISRRLGANLFGAGLLCVGVLIERSFEGQAEIGQLVQAIAALIVSISVFYKAVSGFFANPTRHYTEQLVALAVFAAIAAGDFVSAALVPLLLELGHLFEERSALGAQAAIKRLRVLCTRGAKIIQGKEERSISSEDIEPGMVLVTRPGDVIAADGLVKSGYASIDQSPVTGESNPVSVAPGDSVYAGSVNLDGLIQIQVEKAGNQTVLGEVIRVLQEVENAKTPIVRMLERGASYYLPFIIALGATVLFLTADLDRFITVLIVACPCALVLAAPAAMVASMSRATERSILIKNAAFLEKVATLDTLVLDKTGTLTTGAQSVTGIRTFGPLSKTEVLGLAAATSRGSGHPASRAISKEAQLQDLELPEATSFHEASGRGAEAHIGDHHIRIGRASWLAEYGIEIPAEETETGVWVASGDRAIGFISLFDQPRAEAADVIDSMRNLGFSRIVLLTGDKSEVAERVARELDLDDVIAEVLPAEKLELVRREQQAGRRVLMVGDGMNDALALSVAEIGIAIGADMNEVALGGADVALLSNDLRRLPETIRLADETRQVIFENVFIGLFFSVFMLGLASFGVINPLAGAVLHNAGAIFVVLNSSRLLEKRHQASSTPVIESTAITE